MKTLRILLSLAAVMLVAAPTVLAAAPARAAGLRSTSPVVGLADFGVVGSSTLVRTDHGVSVTRVLAPVRRSKTIKLGGAFDAAATMSVAKVRYTTNRPSPLTDGRSNGPLPLLVPAWLTLTRVTAPLSNSYK